MRKRLLKILRRLLIVVVILGAIGVAAFSWICYWPLEGKVESLELLVPQKVEFVLRGSYEDLRGTGWVQANVLGDVDLHPLLAEQRAQNWPRIQAELARVQAQVNDAIPLGVIDFGVEADVLEGEAMVAGVFCRGTRLPDPPEWQEVLFLKRLGWKARAGLAATLGHGFVRDMAVPAHQARFEVEDEDLDLMKVTLPGVPVRSRIARSGCGDGFEVPPDNEWYLLRVKDVLAISNSKALIKEVGRLSDRAADAGESFVGRPDFEIGPRSGSVVAAMDLDPLHGYLVHALEQLGPQADLLKRYMGVLALRKLNGSLSLEDLGALVADAQIDFQEQDLDPGVADMFGRSPLPIAEGTAELVPAKDTFLVASMRTDPEFFFMSLWEDLPTPDQRALLEENLASVGKYTSFREFIKELAARMDDRAAFAVGRISEVFDESEFEDWFSGDDDEPRPALAFLANIREGGKQEDVDQFLAERIPMLGLSDKVMRRTHMGIQYTRASPELELADRRLLTPCWLLAQDVLIISTNEQYMKQIIETVVDPKLSMARDDRYRTTLRGLADEANISLYLDLEKMFRVPPHSQAGGQPRGFLWDQRNIVVTDGTPDQTAAAAHYEKLKREFQARHGRGPNQQQREAMEVKVDAFAERYRERYPEHIEDYRKRLEGFRRLRSLGLVVTGVEGDRIVLRSALRFEGGN